MAPPVCADDTDVDDAIEAAEVADDERTAVNRPEPMGRGAAPCGTSTEKLTDADETAVEAEGDFISSDPLDCSGDRVSSSDGRGDSWMMSGRRDGGVPGSRVLLPHALRGGTTGGARVNTPEGCGSHNKKDVEN